MADQHAVLEVYRRGLIDKDKAKSLLAPQEEFLPSLPGEQPITQTQLNEQIRQQEERRAQKIAAEEEKGILGRAKEAFMSAAGDRFGIDPGNLQTVSSFTGGQNPILKPTGIPQTLMGAADLGAVAGEGLLGTLSALNSIAGDIIYETGLAGDDGREKIKRELGELEQAVGIVTAVPIGRITAPTRLSTTQAAADRVGDVAQQAKKVVKKSEKVVEGVKDASDKALVRVAIGGAEPKVVARQMVNDALKADKIDPATITSGNLIQRGGEVTRELARAAGGRIGESRNMIEAYKARVIGEQYPRVVRGLESVLGRGTGYFDDVEDLIKSRTELSAPYYAAAREEVVEIPKQLQSLLQRPSLRTAMRRAKILAAESDTKLPNFMEEGAKVTIDDIDLVKRGLDDIIEGYRSDVTGKFPKSSAVDKLKNTRREFLGAIEDLSQNYKLARREFSGPSQSLDALERGSLFFRRKPEQIRMTLKDMPDGDKEFYRAGVLKGLIDEIDKAGANKNVIQNKLTTRDFKKKISAVFEGNDDLADDFVDALLREKQRVENAMFVSSKTGSQTDPRAVSRGFFDRMMNMMDLSQGGAFNVARKAAGAIGGAKAQKAQQEVYDEIARLLTSEIIPPNR